MIRTDSAGLRRGRGVFLLILVPAWVGFAILTVIVVRNPAGTPFDLWLGSVLVDAAESSASLAGAGRFLDVLGGNLVAGLLSAVVVVALVTAHRRWLAAYLAASAVGGLLLSSLVKGVVDRPRPPTVGIFLNEATSSYPSGHATSGITVFVALGLVAFIALKPPLRWWVAAPLFVLGPLIGISRAVLGVHWPTDVLGGWALGVAWTSTAAAIVLTVAFRFLQAQQQIQGGRP